jgi:hypothetical protein
MATKQQFDPEWDLPRKPMGASGLIVWVLMAIFTVMIVKAIFF